jgi:hypothetical protein
MSNESMERIGQTYSVYKPSGSFRSDFELLR